MYIAIVDRWIAKATILPDGRKEAETSEATGYYDLIVRYANGEATGRSLTLYVNGTKEQTLQFPVVSGTDWNAWSEICFSKVLKLNKGDNTVTLVFDNDNNGKLNVDSIAIK